MEQESESNPGERAAQPAGAAHVVAPYDDMTLLAPVACFVLGPDTTILHTNLAGAALLGIARAHPALHQLRSFVDASDRGVLDATVAQAIGGSSGASCPLEVLGNDAGEPTSFSLIADADGSGKSCRARLEPATGKVEALARSEERLRRIVHGAEEGIWEIDANSRTSFVNPKMADLLGYSIEEMLGAPLMHFMDEQARMLADRNLTRRRNGISERHEFKFRRKDGSDLWTSLATHPVFDGDGRYLGAVALVSDITERKESAELIWHQANFDDLTGLPNRHMFLDRLGQEIKKARRSGTMLALLFIDLDRFKDVNDQLGHAQGDQLLIETARRIAGCVRASDTLARLGGDEFTVLLAGLEQTTGVERIAQTIIAILGRPFQLGDELASVSASIGVALYPTDAQTVDHLLAHADQAMYAAKNGGRNRFSYFTQDLQQAAQLRQRIASDLREAISNEQFEIYYQPIVSLQTGHIYKAEALLRWHHPSRGLLNPVEFLQYAESNGLIVDIGDWVFRRAARQVQAWQEHLHPSFQVSVNKSPVQFRRDADSYQTWFDYLSELELSANSLVVEITEGVLVDGASHVVERLAQYRAMGLQVSLDDFGTGHSSLLHLTRYNIDYLKIDQTFVAGLESNAGNLAMCEAIILMAHKLGLRVVAEGVETAMQRALLFDAGCDYAQGFLFAPPLPVEQFEKMARTAVPRLPHGGV